MTQVQIKPQDSIALIDRELHPLFLEECRIKGIAALQVNEYLYKYEPDLNSKRPVFCKSLWNKLKLVEFESIKDAARKLKSISPVFLYFGSVSNRRGSLIWEELLSRISKEKQKTLTPVPIEFGFYNQKHDYPVFTLLSDHLALIAQSFSTPHPSGDVYFIEDKTPPSRAYLKIWEALYRVGQFPKPSDHVLELGAAPGSWSWALAKTGAKVTTVDRAGLELPPSILSNIRHIRGDAFQIKPSEDYQWLFSDLICTPEKLYDYVTTWIAHFPSVKIIATLKFRGAPSFQMIQKFQEIPRGFVLKLRYNKNEATFFYNFEDYNP